MRHIGISNESGWGTMRYLAEAEARGLPRIASIQNAYNLLNRTYEVALAEISLREDVSLLAYSALAQGYLTGKYQKGARPPGARTTLFNRGQRYETLGAEEAIDAYLEIAREAGLDPSQLAIAFAHVAQLHDLGHPRRHQHGAAEGGYRRRGCRGDEGAGSEDRRRAPAGGEPVSLIRGAFPANVSRRRRAWPAESRRMLSL